MGQAVTVVASTSSRPGIVRFEINRCLTGMVHERYQAGDDILGERPVDDLARCLFGLGGVDYIGVFSNVITVQSTGEAPDIHRIVDAIASLHLHYREEHEIPSNEILSVPPTTANRRVYLADLTNTGNGIMALTFPLGVSYVTAYAKQELGDRFDFRLFKFPEALGQAMKDEPPKVLALSNYSWNLELSYKLSALAKKHDPSLVVVFGGPNFPVIPDEKLAFLKQRPAVDFYVELEGEVGFVDLLSKLEASEFDVEAFKQTKEPVGNCSYLSGGELIDGGIERIADVNMIPSPYLTGLMDEFFELPLSPMLETTRGCPFTCTFCVEGRFSYSRVKSFHMDRVQEELRYMAERVNGVNELTITDSNFGMNKWDLATAEAIARVQSEFQWPTLVNASTGKNRQERVIETVAVLKGAWVAGSAVQSSDPDVLNNVKRSNISLDAYSGLMDSMNSLSKDALTYSEIILGLPGDTKDKHFDSLRYAVDSQVNRVHMYEATLLTGTDMDSQETRDKFGLVTKFRLIPGGVGSYEFAGEKLNVAEIEEIIVGSNNMSFEQYLSCRKMNLLIETFVNNGLCDEVFAAMRAMGLSVFELLAVIHRHDELYSKKFQNNITSFIDANCAKLFDSREEVEASVLGSGDFDRYLAGDLGINELLEHKALLYLDLEDSLEVLLRGLKIVLQENGLLCDSTEDYLHQLVAFIACKKQRIQEPEIEIVASFNYDFGNIEKHDYRVNPLDIDRRLEESKLRFFHTPIQKEKIRNAVSMYDNHPDGVNRFLGRENIKKLYREFEPV